MSVSNENLLRAQKFVTSLSFYTLNAIETPVPMLCICLVLTTRSDHTGAFAHDHSSVCPAKSPSGQWITALSAWADVSAVVTDCLTWELRILRQFIFYLRPFREYYGCICILRILGQGRMQSFPYRSQVVAVFVLPFRPKPAPILF